MTIESVMMRTMLVPLIASIRIFAIYVVAHGHYSPGGGFQGGVLFGCSLFLPMLVRDGGARVRPSARGAAAIAGYGLLWFYAVGAAPMFFGYAFMDYAGLPIPGLGPPALRSTGILLAELGIAAAVAGVVVWLYHLLMTEEAAP